MCQWQHLSRACDICGFQGECLVATVIHELVNHFNLDLDITPMALGQDCYDCYWDKVVPFIINIDGQHIEHIAWLSPGSSMLLP